jgi:hypothetical protein
MLRTVVQATAPVLLLAAAAAPAGAITLGIVPERSETAPGAEVEVMVRISGLGDREAPSLRVFDLDLLFDPAVLFFAGLRFGDPVLGNELDPTDQGLVVDEVFDILAPSGRVGFFGESLVEPPVLLDELQAGSFVLATFVFLGIARGESALELEIAELRDAEGNALPAETAAGAISVVTAPSAAALLGVALLAAALGRRVRGARPATPSRG